MCLFFSWDVSFDVFFFSFFLFPSPLSSCIGSRPLKVFRLFFFFFSFSRPPRFWHIRNGPQPFFSQFFLWGTFPPTNGVRSPSVFFSASFSLPPCLSTYALRFPLVFEFFSNGCWIFSVLPRKWFSLTRRLPHFQLGLGSPSPFFRPSFGSCSILSFPPFCCLSAT